MILKSRRECHEGNSRQDAARWPPLQATLARFLAYLPVVASVVARSPDRATVPDRRSPFLPPGAKRRPSIRPGEKRPPGAFALATNAGRSFPLVCLNLARPARTGQRPVPSGKQSASQAELGQGGSPGCCSGSPARSCCGWPTGRSAGRCSSCRPGSPGRSPDSY